MGETILVTAMGGEVELDITAIHWRLDGKIVLDLREWSVGTHLTDVVEPHQVVRVV